MFNQKLAERRRKHALKRKKIIIGRLKAFGSKSLPKIIKRIEKKMEKYVEKKPEVKEKWFKRLFKRK